MPRPAMKRYTVDIEEIKTKRVVVRANTVEEAQSRAVERKWISSAYDKTESLEVVSVPVEVEDANKKAAKDIAIALYERLNEYNPEMIKDLWSKEFVKGTTWGEYFASHLR
jgi:actin-like ATPase involved in cell morphogenesis